MSSTSQHDAVLASIQALLISNPDMMAAMQQFMDGQAPRFFVKVAGFGNVAPSKAKVDAKGVYSPPGEIIDGLKISVPEEPMDQLQSHIPSYLELVSKVKELKRVEADLAAKAQVVQDLEKSIENDRKWIEVLEQQETQAAKESHKSEGFSFKSVKAKINGKADENQHKLEDIRKEKAGKETSIRESTAKLEKARIGLQLVTSDTSALSVVRKDLHDLLEMALSTHSENNYLDLISAAREAKQLADHISRDTKSFKAAQSLCQTIHTKCTETAEHLNKVRSERWNVKNDQMETIELCMYNVHKCMREAQESRKLLCELISDIDEKLPSMELQFPPFLIEFTGYSGMTYSEIASLQDFVLRKNVEILKKLTKKAEVLLAWLNKAIDSMETVEAVATMDAKGKETQLNLFRMGCFEKAAVAKGSKPEAMGEAELTLLLSAPQ
ncbi:hypothetical protein HDU97_002685 [Phlyctochytrium planicorne]|nr:hypothetical protein HDU97_002685 [Phlyctochytrium planicorne]